MCKNILISMTSDTFLDLYNISAAYDYGYDFVIPVANVTAKNFEEIFLEAYFGRDPDCIHNTVFFINIRPQNELNAVIKIINSLRERKIRPTVILDPRGAYTTGAAIFSILLNVTHTNSYDLSKLSVVILGGAGSVGAAIVKYLSTKVESVVVIDKSEEKINLLKKSLENSSHNIKFVKTSNKQEFVKYCRNTDVVLATGPPKVTFIGIEDLHNSKCKIAIDINSVTPEGIIGIHPEDNNTFRLGIRCFGYRSIGSLKRQIQKKLFAKALSVHGKIFDLNEIYNLLDPLNA